MPFDGIKGRTISQKAFFQSLNTSTPTRNMITIAETPPHFLFRVLRILITSKRSFGGRNQKSYSLSSALSLY